MSDITQMKAAVEEMTDGVQAFMQKYDRKFEDMETRFARGEFQGGGGSGATSAATRRQSSRVASTRAKNPAAPRREA